jgi:putative nucleotidyltransferase with HDIG domain
MANTKESDVPSPGIPQGHMIEEKSLQTDNPANSEAVLSQEGSPSPLTLDIPSKAYKSELGWRAKLIRQLEKVNKELWLILSMFVIVGAMNYLVTSQRMLLGFYTLPTLFSAYFYGCRHATLAAFASVFLVGLVARYNPGFFTITERFEFVEAQWYDITAWGTILVITAYAMGTLYEHKAAHIHELRHTYRGLLVILRHFISKDEYSENHCYRVSIYAAKIGARLGLDPERIEDIRSAAFLHDIGKLDISRELLYKAARLSKEEFERMKGHADHGAEMLEPIGGSLGRIIPIILAHHDKYDGSGYHATLGEDIPLEARVLSVVDVYDSLASDRPYRKAMSPFEAKEIIAKGEGTQFDPRVVKAFKKGEMEVPHLVI